MSRLFMFLLAVSSFVLAAAGVSAMLIMGRYDWAAILPAGALGAVAGVPVAWAITRRIKANDPKNRW